MLQAGRGLVHQGADAPGPGRKFLEVAALESITQQRAAQADRKYSCPDPGGDVVDVHAAGRYDLDVRERAAQLGDVAGTHSGGGENLYGGRAQLPSGVEFGGRQASWVDGDTAADAGCDDVRVGDGGDDVRRAKVHGRFCFVGCGDGSHADFQGVAKPLLQAGQLVPDSWRAQGQFDAQHSAELKCFDDGSVIGGVAGTEDGHNPGCAEDCGWVRALKRALVIEALH